jgi:bilirubin oxidase
MSAQNQVLIPDTLVGTAFDLTLQNGTFRFYSNQNTTTMGVNGNILGPTLIMNHGDFVDIKVNNQLADTTTIHWHGMHVSASNDGGPHTTIAPSKTWNPRFTVMDKAGTYWYHPHLHKKTNKHVSLGIAGFIFVRDSEEAALNLPRKYGVDDFPLVIQTKDFDANQQIVVPSNSDDIVMVNATIKPFLNVPAQVVRLRLLNGSSQRVFNLGLSGNLPFYQIASDGGFLSKPVLLTRLQLAPGERAEILVDFSGKKGQSVHLMSYASELPYGIYGAALPGMMQMTSLTGYNPNPLNGSNFIIIEFKITAQSSNPVLTVLSSLAVVSRLKEPDAILTRNLTISPAAMGPNQLNGKFLINGLLFNMDVINFSIPLNNTEIWSITNQSAIAHPFHIHNVQFYVLDRNGVSPAPGEQGRKDVILIKPMETVRFITQFTDFANDSVPYMFHCHMLVHEDDGMMLQFEVVDKTTATTDKKMNSSDVQVFPNPLNINDRKLTVTGINGKLLKVDLYNINGQKITGKIISPNSNQIEIAIPELTAGIYLLTIGNERYVYTKKIEVQ